MGWLCPVARHSNWARFNWVGLAQVFRSMGFVLQHCNLASEHFVCSHLAPLVCSQFGPSAGAQRSAGGKVAEIRGRDDVDMFPSLVSGNCAKHPLETQLQAGRIPRATSSSNASRVTWTTSTTSSGSLLLHFASFVATLTHQFDGVAPPIGSAKSCANFGGAARNLASKRRPVRGTRETLRMLSSIQVVLGSVSLPHS